MTSPRPKHRHHHTRDTGQALLHPPGQLGRHTLTPVKRLGLVLLKRPQASVWRLIPPWLTGQCSGIGIAGRMGTRDPFDDAQLFADQPDLGRLLPTQFTVDAAFAPAHGITINALCDAARSVSALDTAARTPARI